MDPAQLFDRIAKLSPDFAPAMMEHVGDNDVLIVHVLMGDLLRYLGTRLGQVGTSAPPDVLAVLELLEHEVSGGDANTENVIAVSFLENLEAEPFFPRLYALLGPNLRAAHAPFAWNQGGPSVAG